MSTPDEDVLTFIGRQGKTAQAISARFPEFDMLRLVRAGLVTERSIEPETLAHGHMSAHVVRHYALTERGAVAVGISPR